MTPFLVTGVLAGAAYGLLALGFVLIYRGTRVFNLAHGEIGALGLYVAWSLLNYLPMLLAALVGIAASAAAGVAVERLLVRRISGAPPLTGATVTLGVGLSMAYLMAMVWGYNVKTFPSLVGTGSFRVSSTVVTAPRFAALVVVVVAVVGLGVFLTMTRLGLSMRATTSDEDLARVSGIAVGRTRAVTWAIAGALSAVSAMLLAPVLTFHPLSNTLTLIRALAAALLGGLVSIPGALLGGLLVGVTENVAVKFFSEPGAADLAIFLLILGSLLARPEGVLSARSSR